MGCVRIPSSDALEVSELEDIILSGPRNAAPALEGRVKLRSLEDWARWKKLYLDRRVLLDALATEILTCGFTDPIAGLVEPSEIHGTEAPREGFLGRGVNSRQRAVLRALCQREARFNSRIYGAEAVTPLARCLSVFPRERIRGRPSGTRKYVSDFVPGLNQLGFAGGRF